MPGHIVTADASVQCAHGGQAKPILVNARVKIGGQPVVTQSGPWSVSGCPLQPPPAGPSPPCVVANFTSAATRVKAGKMPVLLKDSQSTCVPTGTPLQIASTQTRVKAQ